MIIFSGEISGECKRFLLRRKSRLEFLANLLVSTIFLIPTVLLAIFWKPIILVFLAPYIAFIAIPLIPISEKEQKKFIPTKIIFDTEEESVVLQGDNFERFHMFYAIETVKDYGLWYDLQFKYGDKDVFAVCQKDLLTNGTLEEFEKLFEDKIVKE